MRKRIRLLTLFTAGAAFLSFIQPVIAQVSCPPPGGNNCELLPDMIAGKKTLNSTAGWTEYSQLVTGLNRGLIRIDVSTPNIGWGPLEVQSTNNYLCGTDTLFNFFPTPSFLCPDGTYPKRLIKQNVYSLVNGVTIVTPRDAGWMEFHPAHGHIHIEGWGMYSIRLQDASVSDTLQWPVVNRGIKVSFCLIDLTTCSSSLGDCVDANGTVLNNASFPNYGLGGPYNSCGDVKQGISVGKVDIYHRGLDESFVKIPYEACNGNYFVMVEIDPDNHFQEINENNNWLAAKIPFAQQRPANTGPYAYIFSKKGNTFCSGSLDLEASGANSYLWSTGATTQKINITQPGEYWVRTVTPCGTTTSDTMLVVQKTSTTMPAITVADTVCTGEKATLFASGNARWYDAAVAGNLIYTGNSFQTPLLNASATYYVEDEPVDYKATLGPAGSTFVPSGVFNAANTEFLVFNAFIPFRLSKVTVNAEVAGVRTIQLRTLYGKLIAQKQVSLVAGVQEIDLNFNVPSGLNHQLGLATNSPVGRLFMNTSASSNIGFPFTEKAVAKIVGSSRGDVAYPFFYNWKIETDLPSCVTRQRKAVTALVVPRPIVAIAGLQPTYLHTDGPVQITGTPPGGVLMGPSTGFIANSFYPRLSGVGTFDFVYSYDHPYCPTQDSKTVIVKFNEDLMQDGFDIKLFNTPSHSPQLQVTTRENSAITIRLISNTGQLVQQYSVNAVAGTNMYNIDLAKPAREFYTLEVYHAASGKRKTIKLIN